MCLCIHLLPLLVYVCSLFDYEILVVPLLYIYACSVDFDQGTTKEQGIGIEWSTPSGQAQPQCCPLSKLPNISALAIATLNKLYTP
jgi:hypothetical protein